MKKMLVFMLMLLSVAGMAFAGSLENYEYNNNADERSDSNVTVDADTLEGNPASYFVPLTYVQSQESLWEKDLVGGNGLSTRGLSSKLVGRPDLFERFDTFVDYLSGIFAKAERVSTLEARVDTLEAHILGLTTDEYQKAKATETGSYGPYTCAEDICIKNVN